MKNMYKMFKSKKILLVAKIVHIIASLIGLCGIIGSVICSIEILGRIFLGNFFFFFMNLTAEEVVMWWVLFMLLLALFFCCLVYGPNSLYERVEGGVMVAKLLGRCRLIRWEDIKSVEIKYEPASLYDPGMCMAIVSTHNHFKFRLFLDGVDEGLAIYKEIKKKSEELSLPIQFIKEAKGAGDKRKVSFSDRLEEANELMATGEKEEAHTILQSILQDNPKRRGIYQDIVNIYMLGCMYKEAKEVFRIYKERTGKELHGDFDLKEIEEEERKALQNDK